MKVYNGKQSIHLPTKLNIAALIRPTLSPKFSSPAASADKVIVKLSHDKTIRVDKGQSQTNDVLLKARYSQVLSSEISRSKRDDI